MVAEYDGAGAILHRYVHGSNASADDPLLEYSGAGLAGKKWLHADRLGSIVAATDGAGGNPAINSYDEYGIPGPANSGRFQYTGQAWLPELGMYYYKARIYSPTLGRFLQTDRIGYQGGLNLYAYVDDDPINKTDPDGLLPPENLDPKKDWATQTGKMMERAANSPPVNPVGDGKQAAGAAKDMATNYVKMRTANTEGADKYYHCKANCQASARGPVGEATARSVSNSREAADRAKGDPAAASASDQRANEIGRQAGRNARQVGGDTDAVCRARCGQLGPSRPPPEQQSRVQSVLDEWLD